MAKTGTNIKNYDNSPDMGNVDYVVEWQKPTERNGYTWYRLYASGWITMGFIKQWNGAWNVTSLPHEMLNDKYTIVGSGYRTDGSPYQGFVCFKDYTTTSVNIWFSDDSSSNAGYARILVEGLAKI
ncbi:hypothetical protein J6W34_00215 [bacterium]|nr:hypothetical protein [bacterium]